MSRHRHHRRHRALAALALVLVALTLVAAQCAPAAPARTTPAAAVDLLVLPEAGSGPLIQAIDAARATLRLKAYLITEDDVVAALQRAARRGVDVRVLLEPEPEGGGDSNRLAKQELQQAGVAVRDTPGAFRLSHEKSLVVDGTRAFIMTHNLTYSSFHKNREYAAVVDDPALVAEVVAVFEADWERRQPDLREASLVWSPVNSRDRLTALLDGARETLFLQQSSILDDALVDRLLAAARRGVEVRLVTPEVTDPDDWEYEPLSRLAAGGVAVRFLDDPYMHAKAILADGQRALVGSQNFTRASLDDNRELGIIFEDAAAINRLAATFAADWAQAAPMAVAGPAAPAPAAPAAPTAAAPAAPAGEVVPWQEAGQHAGEVITVAGDIVDTYNAGSIAFLNFSRDRADFTLVVFDEDFDRFPEPPERLYDGQRVRATGKVELHNGRPQMAISGPEQMEVVGPAESSQVVPAVAPAPAGETIAWEDAGQYLGQRVTVAGDIVRTYNSGKVVFLNFAKEYRGTFTVVIFASDFAKWPEPPEDLYLNKLVRVTGKVKEYRGAPEIIVEDPEQIEIVAPADGTGTVAGLQPTSLAGAEAQPQPISWEDAAGFEGQEVAVVGRVVDTYKSDKVIFLNFSPDRSEFKAVIFASAWDRWPRPPHELYYGQSVCITGTVVMYNQAPEIIIDAPEQISIVAGLESPMEP